MRDADVAKKSATPTLGAIMPKDGRISPPIFERQAIDPAMQDFLNKLARFTGPSVPVSAFEETVNDYWEGWDKLKARVKKGFDGKRWLRGDSLEPDTFVAEPAVDR